MEDKQIKRVIVITAISTSILVVGLIKVIPVLTGLIKNWESSEILTFFTGIGVLVAFSSIFLNYWFQKKLQEQTHKCEKEEEEAKKRSLYQIDIHTKVLDNQVVLFSAYIENVGEKSITIKRSHLYIDEGIPTPFGDKIVINKESHEKESGAVYYAFPFLLKHGTEEGKASDECILCKKCREKDNENITYPKELLEDALFKDKDLYNANISLKHLSSESIQYINPDERFSEDVILKFKRSGVYRVTFVVLPEGEALCECATKQFYIP